MMRVAVITPTYQTPRAWLDQCVRSVAEQSYRCTHFLVSDGDEALGPPGSADVRFLRLPGPHADSGNAARPPGSSLAPCEVVAARGFPPPHPPHPPPPITTPPHS